MKRDRLTEYAIELQSLAQAGLHCRKDIYDRERGTERIREIAAEIISMKTELPLDTVTGMFCSDSGYQERRRSIYAPRYSETGKFCSYTRRTAHGRSPAAGARSRCLRRKMPSRKRRRKRGSTSRVKSVIAVQNRDFHNLPPYAYGVVKIFYLCGEAGGEFAENSETVRDRLLLTGPICRRSPKKNAARTDPHIAFARTAAARGKPCSTESAAVRGETQSQPCDRYAAAKCLGHAGEKKPVGCRQEPGCGFR